MKRTVVLLLTLLLSINLAAAVTFGDGHEFNHTTVSWHYNSWEPVVVRTFAANLDTNEYTFSCETPEDADTLLEWNVRGDDDVLLHTEQTTQTSLTWTLLDGEFYHFTCATWNSTTNPKEWIMSDMHIDLRTTPYTNRPNVNVLSTNGTNFTAHCSYPYVNQHTKYWFLQHPASGQQWSLTEFDGLDTITLDLPEPGLWDFSCGVWDDDNSTWTQTGLPVEFFSQGEAYVPTADGCVPGEGCPIFLQNSTISAPTWLEPSENKTGVDPHSFKLHVNDFFDGAGNTHTATDYEIWDLAGTEVVWHAPDETLAKFRIESGDGTFINSLAATDQLLENTTYKARARFETNATIDNIGPWSEWRYFTTRPELVFNESPFEWTAREGFTVELVADDINLPTDLVVAPDIYGHLPEGQRPKLYFTHLYGEIGVLLNDGTYVEYANGLLNFESLGSLPGSGEIGVTGLYVDDITGDIYVSHVYVDEAVRDDGYLSKVVRFTTNENGTGYNNTTTLLDEIPSSPAHQAHKIIRGPDGKLYLNTGDNDIAGDSKDISKLTGKILRFNEDGSIPVDNPFPGTYVYAAGFRNPFGAAWRPGTSELYVTHNGPDEDDGLFKVFGGDVFGWCCSTEENSWHTWAQTVAPVGLTFNDNNPLFPNETNGSLFVALSGKTYAEGQSLLGKRIVEFKVLPDGTRESVGELITYTGEGYGTPIGLAFDDDGLYFTDIYGDAGFVGVGETRGRIYRVVPGNQTEDNETQNESLSAGIATAPWYPQGNNVVWECKAFDGSGDYLYDYDFGDGSYQFGTASDNVYHTYPGNGTYNPGCTVHDQITLESASAYTTLVIGDGIGSSGNETGGNETGNETGGGNETGEDNETNSTVNGCFETLENMPVSCIGGTFTLDTYNGCRTLLCEGPGNSLQILACDKPGAIEPTHFEMYLQSQSGTGLEICIGDSCLNPVITGYVKSDDYPLCFGNATNTTDPLPLFSIAIDDAASTVDSDLADDILEDAQALFTETFPLDTIKLFSEVDALDIADFITVAVFEQEAVVIAGEDSETPGFVSDVETILDNLLVSYETIDSSEVSSSDLMELFNGTNETGNGSNETGNETCYTNLEFLPATCTSGSITSDTYNGCRSISCVDGASSLDILACDKPGTYNPTHFEMYLQGQSGSGLSICLGDTCLDPAISGYSKSPDYPMCVA